MRLSILDLYYKSILLLKTYLTDYHRYFFRTNITQNFFDCFSQMVLGQSPF
ncbi:MAG: hypothetical protein ACI976_000948 [Aureispira sp.]|jgi:hypothetical protein